MTDGIFVAGEASEGRFSAGDATDRAMGAGAIIDGTFVAGEVVVSVAKSSVLKWELGALESTGRVLHCEWPGIKEARRVWSTCGAGTGCESQPETLSHFACGSTRNYK